jgi:hypothetical protein
LSQRMIETNTCHGTLAAGSKFGHGTESREPDQGAVQSPNAKLKGTDNQGSWKDIQDLFVDDCIVNECMNEGRKEGEKQKEQWDILANTNHHVTN